MTDAQSLADATDAAPPRPVRNFDRVAQEYDATRGGRQRARTAARDLLPHLTRADPAPAGKVLEIGIGTGIVAEALLELADPPLGELTGVDISRDMLALARQRLPGRLIRASALALPFPDGTFDNVVGAHILHLVTDLRLCITETARVLRPGGRFVVIHGPLMQPDDELVEATRQMHELKGAAPDRPEAVRTVAEAVGLRCLSQHPSSPQPARHSPAGLADLIERRSWSSLWDLDDATWQERVVPVIERLRAMPDPDRPRPQEARATVSVLERP